MSYDDEYDYPGPPSRRIWYVIGGAALTVLGIAAVIWFGVG